MPQPQVTERASLRYRPDIDGLRAVAVVPVVLYHYGIAPFCGGYAGVDVFFVISGFLITSLISAEMRSGEFSILRFYERRARRILPALFVVLAASTVAACAILFPRDLSAFGESLASTAVFGSNIDFWSRSGYFDAGATLKPLLHTWSLAVEEQYYLLFPALLCVLHTRTRRGLLVLVVGLAVASFAASVWAVVYHPSAAFYLVPYRMWELMLGAALALVEIPRLASALLREGLALLGLALIGWAVFAFTPHTPFPGANALYPCAGAALLIFTGEAGGSAINRALSCRPIVVVGLLSYSFYLWHWPLYVFANYLSYAPLGLAMRVALIAAAFALAWISWRYVEQPFRLKRHLFDRRRLFLLTGAGMAASIAIGLALMAVHGWPQRFAPQMRRILAEADDYEPRRHACFSPGPARAERGDFCTIGDSRAARPSFILWGDSHADAILPAVETVARDRHRKGLFIALRHCPPLLDIRLSDEPSERCARLNAEALTAAAKNGIREAILVARWANYDQGTGVGVDADQTFGMMDRTARDAPGMNRHAIFARLLARTIDTLMRRGFKVVLVADVPEPGVAVPEAMARIARAGADIDIRPTLDAYRAREFQVRQDFSDLARAFPVNVLDPSPVFCDSQRCAVAMEGRPLYFDDHHLSVFGALHLVPLLARAM